VRAVTDQYIHSFCVSIIGAKNQRGITLWKSDYDKKHHLTLIEHAFHLSILVVHVDPASN
jgi:hypothetical protein